MALFDIKNKRHSIKRLQKQPTAHLHRKRNRVGTYIDPDECYYSDKFGLRYEPTNPK